jgi:hypothetical protein
MVAETEILDAETGEPETNSRDVAVRHEGNQVAAHQSQEATLLGIIERVASNPDVDIERMQALLNMRAEEERQRRIAREDSEEAARREFLQAFSAAQAEIGPIRRSKTNDHTRSTYATLEDIERIVTPVLTKHGFSTTALPIPCDVAGCIRVRLTIGHAGGYERHYEDDFPIDGAGSKGNTNKTDIQAKGSTQTYGRRYLKAIALDLAFTDDDDGNARQQRAADAEPLSEERVKHIRRELEAMGVDEAGFCEYLKVPNLIEMPAGRFSDACEALAAKRRKDEKAKAQAEADRDAEDAPEDQS